MKKVADCGWRIVALTALFLPNVSLAADWFSNGGEIDVLASWTNAKGEVCPAFSDTDVYWITRDAAGQGYSNFSLKNVCLGSPTDSPAGFTSGRLKCNFQNKTLTVANFVWYNGSVHSSQKKQSWFSGTARFVRESSAVVHRIYNNVKDGCVGMNMNLETDDPSVVLQIGGMGATLDYAGMMLGYIQGNAYFTFHGDNSNFKGSFSVLSPYQTVWLGGDDALGCPECPNLAAMTLCNNGAFAFMNSCRQSTTRGIRLDGDQAYLLSWSEPTDAGAICRYPISREASAVGKLIKDGPGVVTLDCAYSAGPIEVAAGTLVLGANATLPEGQVIVVKDGATLKCVYNPNIDYTQVTITTEGTGTVTYDDGYRLNNGVWEASVTMAVEGDGTVDATAWAPVGSIVTRTATAGAEAFIAWKGDLAMLVDRDPFATIVRVRVEKPLALTAVFGTLVPPANVECPDGTTFVFANRMMTVMVPAGVTNDYDYAAALSSGYVTSIVKTGAGDLTLAVAPDYIGNFTVSEGRIVVTAVGALGHDDIGTVTVAADAALVNRYLGNDASSGKLFHLAGTGYIDCIDSNSYCPISGMFVLDADATFYSGGPNRKGLGFHQSTFDLNGHVLTFSESKWNTIALTDVLFTNSSDQASQIKSASNSQRYSLTRVTFAGGAQNRFVPGFSDVTINSVAADWTLAYEKYTLLLKTPTVATTGNSLDYRWNGPVTFTGNQTSDTAVDVGDQSGSVSALTFGGRVESSFDASRIQITGFCNILDSANFAKGATLLPGNTTLRTGLYLWNGATGFTCGEGYALNMSGTDLWMDDATAFSVGSLVCTDDCRILGGPLGNAACGRATIAGITQSDSDGEEQVLTIDSSAQIGPVHVTSKLALAPGKTADELPLFDDVGFADGAVFDMQGNDLTVTGLTGFPTITNPGALTIAGTWTIDQADILAGKCLNLGGKALTFADGAKIVIVNRTTSSQQSFVIAQTTGGITGSPVTQGWRRDVEIKDGKLALSARGLVLIFQ